jgi:uncharacterized membrane protein YdbT with pleckstrin-like domain
MATAKIRIRCSGKTVVPEALLWVLMAVALDALLDYLGESQAIPSVTVFERDIRMFFAATAVIRLCWAWLAAWCTSYEINDQHIDIHWGVFNREQLSVDVTKLKDFRKHRSLIWRLLGLSNIEILSAHRSIQTVWIYGIDATIAEGLYSDLVNDATDTWIELKRRFVRVPK